MHLNKKKHIHTRSKRKYKNIKKTKNIKTYKKTIKNKSKRRNKYEEMYYQPVVVPLISFRTKSKSLTKI